MTTPYIYHNNILCVRSKYLIDSKIIKENTYRTLTQRGWLNILQKGGNGRVSLVEFESIRPDIKAEIVDKAGDPYKTATKSILQDLVLPDLQAAKFFEEYRKPNGEPLSSENKKKYITNTCIYNGIQTMLKSEQSKSQFFKTNKKTEIWKYIAGAVNKLENFEHSISPTARVIQRNYEKYIEQGYISLVHGNEGNDNSQAIKGKVEKWIIGVYGQPTKIKLPELVEMYDRIREQKGFPEVSEQAIRNCLEKPANKRIWEYGRHGREIFNNKFGYSFTRDKSNWYPNVYWVIDGTKLDALHYFDNTQKWAAKMKINPVIDVYSEKIIGYSLSKTENHFDHFTAIKMAINHAGCKPYLMTYDNQSGHKSARMQELYSKLMASDKGTHYPHQAYRHSNPIEQIFGRLQQQEISPLWFSDKQSVTAKREDNRPNMDFIMENKHRLPTEEGLVKVWEAIVYRWNNSKHPHFDKTRNEVYEEAMPNRENVDALDMVSIFWIQRPRPVTYRRSGLLMRIGNDSFEYEVYDDNGIPDLEFRRRNIGNKFFVRYDPEYLNDYIQLYAATPSGMVHVADAQPKVKFEVVPALMRPGEKERFLQFEAARNLEYKMVEEQLQKAYKEAGMTPEDIIDQQESMIKMGGKLPKELRSELESQSALHRL